MKKQVNASVGKGLDLLKSNMPDKFNLGLAI